MTSETILRPVLTLVRNGLKDVSFPLEIHLDEFFEANEKIVIGRAPKCNIQIPSSLVRTLHAIIKRKRNNFPKDTFSYYFIDVSCRLLINSSLLEVRIHSGDVIDLVPSALRVKFELVEGLSKKKVTDLELENARLSAQVADLKTELLDQKKQRLQALSTHEKMVNDLELDFQTLRTELDDKESEVVSTLESEYSCAICNGIFIHPSSLLCGHTFCLHCLRQWLTQVKKCPICREPCRETNDPKKNVSIAAMIERAYGELLSNEDLRTKRADALKEREEEVKMAATAAAPLIPAPPSFEDENVRQMGPMEYHLDLDWLRRQQQTLEQTLEIINNWSASGGMI